MTRSPLEKTPSILPTVNSKIVGGYIIGGGLDFAITDNFILRAEYNYSDFGKKDISDNKMKVSYKINGFYFGGAYK
ncbi:MAG: porin, partial [Bartonella sp.]|nr:porin [Bartonella sp.]